MSERASRIVNVGEQTCPRRMGELGPWDRKENQDHWQRGRWAATQAEADQEVAEFMAQFPTGGIGHVLWSYGGEQPRTCSFCGGVHPEDAIALIAVGNWRVEGTTKGYKRYLQPPHGFPSPVPPVKLYVQHFNEDQIARFNGALGDRG